MNSFIKESDFFKGNNIEEIARQYGTPLYVYNEDILVEKMHDVRDTITKYPYQCNYSIKANSNLELLKIALREGLSCDAMSEGELRLLMKAGFPKDRIFFVPNNIDENEMQFAIDNDILTSLDSIDQLEMFGRLNPGGRCAVRINPGVGAGHHDKVVTAGKNTKFAISMEDVDEIFVVAKKYDLKVIGINQHVGSLYMTPEPFLEAVDNLIEVAGKFGKLEFIDFGGGYGIPYHKLDDEPPFDFKSFSIEFTKKLDYFVEKYGYTPLFKSEPGRYVVAECGVILGRVNATKENAGKIYAGTDVGMNVLARPTLYDSFHDIEIVRNGEVIGKAEASSFEKVTVTGNICESGDVLCKERLLPKIEDNDLICVLDAGAYGYSMCYPYNQRLRPAEIMIMHDGSVKLVRRRETFEDLFAYFVE